MRTRILTLVALLMPALVGCSVGGAGSDRDNRPAGDKLQTLVYVNPLPDSHLWNRIGSCMEKEAKKRGIAMRTVGASGGDVDIQAMQNLVSQAIATKADAIVTWSNVGSEGFDALFARQKAQGGLVATLLSRGATKNQTFDVDADPQADLGGHLEAMAELPGRRHVGMILQTAEGPEARAYDEAINGALKRHANLTLVDTRYDEGRFGELTSIVSAMLTAHPEINTVYNYSGHPGVWAAIATARGDRDIVGFAHPGDSPESVLPYIDQGVVGGLGGSDYCRTGRLVVTKLLDARAGRPVDREMTYETFVVGPEKFRRLVEAGRFP